MNLFPIQFLRRDFGQLAASVFAVLSTTSALASTVIDFEANGEPSLVYASTVYTQGDYVVSSPYDYSIIGYANDGDPVAPTGDSSLFYSVLNGNTLTLARKDGGLFDLLSFDAALLPSYPSQTFGGEVVFDNAHADFTTGLVSANVPPSSTGHYPFIHFDNLGDIPGADGRPAFRNLVYVEVFGCMFVSDTLGCDTFANNQLALDNLVVQVSAVPEPTNAGLMAIGVLALTFCRRKFGRALSAALRAARRNDTGRHA